MQPFQTRRLTLLPLCMDMVSQVQALSVDADNRRYVPDEVFETIEEAADTVQALISFYGQPDAPQVYGVMRTEGELIGWVQAAPLEGGWELGYHIGADYAGQGYATEAAQAFLPCIMDELGIDEMAGICLADNAASRRVLEKLGGILEFEGVAPYQGVPRPICRMRLILFSI